MKRFNILIFKHFYTAHYEEYNHHDFLNDNFENNLEPQNDNCIVHNALAKTMSVRENLIRINFSSEIQRSEQIQKA